MNKKSFSNAFFFHWKKDCSLKGLTIIPTSTSKASKQSSHKKTIITKSTLCATGAQTRFFAIVYSSAM